MVFFSLFVLSGCAVIAGREDAGSGARQGFMLRFVESLRSELSLRGETGKEPQFSTPPDTFLQQPNSVFADEFRVYVTDTYMSLSIPSPRILLFDRVKRTMSTVPIPQPPDEGKLVAPVAIACDPSNVIFVADSQQGLVFGYDQNGKLLMTIGKTGDIGKPVALAVDRTHGWLYVADAAGRRVKVFNTLGNLMAELGDQSNPDQDYRLPASISLDSQGNLYVLDSRKKRVFVYDASRQFVQRFSLRDAADRTPLQPRGIAVDSDGHIYVTDMASNNVIIYDRDGVRIKTWGRTGSLSGDFWSPQGIFIDTQDRIYIADRMNSRVQVFQYVRLSTPLP